MPKRTYPQFIRYDANHDILFLFVFYVMYLIMFFLIFSVVFFCFLRSFFHFFIPFNILKHIFYVPFFVRNNVYNFSDNLIAYIFIFLRDIKKLLKITKMNKNIKRTFIYHLKIILITKEHVHIRVEKQKIYKESQK